MTEADLLRRAAALMRERAEAATPGPWVIYGEERDQYVAGKGGSGDLVLDGSLLPLSGWHACIFDVHHIAAWHPGVALAVADWLDATAEAHEDEPQNYPLDLGALTVARAYLGEVTTP